MIRNPQIGMRVRFTDVSGGKWLGKAGTIRYFATTSYQYYTDNCLVGVAFDGENFIHEFHLFRFSPIDPDSERRDQERLADQKRRKAHADKYL